MNFDKLIILFIIETGEKMRIALMVFRLLPLVPYYMIKIWICSISKRISYETGYKASREITKAANWAGRVTIEAHGIENIPKENGFIFFPNHQGLFDVLTFFQTCTVPFAVVIKKEASNIILLKQVLKATGSLIIDREDLRQSMTVIKNVTEEVKNGRNFLIFAEGTRSRNGNELLDFKGGSFKSAVKAKCPIVPVALIDSFKPFDENSMKRVTVKIIYLPPIYYEEYKNMKTVEIAKAVKDKIEKTIGEYE